MLFALSDVGPVIVFNTLLPQRDPSSWGVFDLPLPPDPLGRYSICAQYEKSQTEFPEFSVDPAQRIFVVSSLPDLALAFPVGLFMRYMNSVRTNRHVSWNEWGGDTIAVRLHPSTLQLQILNTKILALRTEALSLGQWGVEMFDLSVSGRREIGEGAGGGCNRVFSRSKWSVLCPRGDRSPYRVIIVGNNVYFSVSPLNDQRLAILSVTSCRTGRTRPVIIRSTSVDMGQCERQSRGSRTRETVRSVYPVHLYQAVISIKPVVMRICMSRLKFSYPQYFTVTGMRAATFQEPC